jgi:hypothetical protein
VPVGPEVIAAARNGDWQVVPTPTRPVPRNWFPDLAGLEVLCLDSGDHTLEGQAGGQLDAGSLLAGLYEAPDPNHPVAKFLPTYLTTRAVRPPYPPDLKVPTS